MKWDEVVNIYFTMKSVNCQPSTVNCESQRAIHSANSPQDSRWLL